MASKAEHSNLAHRDQLPIKEVDLNIESDADEVYVPSTDVPKKDRKTDRGEPGPAPTADEIVPYQKYTNIDGRLKLAILDNTD